MRRSVALLASAAAIVVVHSSLAVAQSAQPYAFQIAGFSTAVAVGHEAVVTTGYGVEPQLRMNRLYSGERFGALSLGVGGQWTSHTEASDKMKIIGAFLEPRWVPALGTTHIFPYLSARVAFLRQSSNFGTASTGEAVGGGGGLGIKLTNTMNLDAGAQFISQKFGLFNFSDDGSLGPSTSLSTFAAKVGFSWGFPGH
ncbi:MAG: hypothetical protein ABIT38_03280 [Gemmatimonadaceae bacterium]